MKQMTGMHCDQCGKQMYYYTEGASGLRCGTPDCKSPMDFDPAPPTVANRHEEVQALIRKIIPHYEGSSGSLEVYGSDVLAVFMAGRASLGRAGQLPERKPKGWQCEQGIYPADGFNACLDLMTPIVLEQRLLMRNAQKVIEQFMPNAGSCFGIDFGLLNDTLFALAKATRPTPQDSPAGAVNVGAHRDNDGLDSFRQPKE